MNKLYRHFLKDCSLWYIISDKEDETLVLSNLLGSEIEIERKKEWNYYEVKEYHKHRKNKTEENIFNSANDIMNYLEYTGLMLALYR